MRFPSVSGVPSHGKDVAACAEWLVGHVAGLGLEHAAVLPAAGHPVVYADWLHAPGRPTVLVYGHYDVVPASPCEEWRFPPFDGVVADGALHGRGAATTRGSSSRT